MLSGIPTTVFQDQFSWPFGEKRSSQNMWTSSSVSWSTSSRVPTKKSLGKIISEIGDAIMDSPNFSKDFQKAFERWNRFVEAEKEQRKVMSSFANTEMGRKLKKKNKVNNKQQEEHQEEKSVETEKSTNQESEAGIVPSEPSPPQSPNLSGSVSPAEDEDEDASLSPRERLERNQKRKKQEADRKKAEKNNSKQMAQPTTKKVLREKDSMDIKNLTKADMERFNYSKRQEGEQAKSNKYDDDELIQKQLKKFVEEESEVVEESSFFKRIVGGVQGVIGNKSITKDDLKPVLTEFKQKLMQKNVAQDVAEKIVESVGQTLLETKTKSFTSVKATMYDAIKDALTKILTPKRHIDLVAEVAKSQKEHKPYVVVFIGVNGVGKSTNLAKVAYMLKNSKFSVMLAACDNFRAGAVEQLKVHGKNLDIPVFDRGYKEEPPEIAYQAIKEAVAKRIDVVLIDTAGRMQDNVPLMKALARIVSVNKPNLVVFIGEALVGNDAIDQISKFNQAISDYSGDDSRRQIDAIILSKFDTVDDKVGTAVSMCYTTSKPVLYVGVGQKYQHLKKLNINTIVQSLLRD